MQIRIYKSEFKKGIFDFYRRKADEYFHIGVQGIFRVLESTSLDHIIFKVKLENNDLSREELKHLIINKINIVEC